MGNTGAVPRHLIPDYPSVLAKGFKGLEAEFAALKKTARNEEHRDFLDALIVCCEAARGLALRYAEEAERLAAAESDRLRAEELTEIARICRKVPWEPAENFYEAIQSLWLTHMLVMTCEGYPGPGLSPGRIDQYLYPFYQADIEEGRLTRENAREILDCYFIKHNYAYDYQGRIGENQGINSSFRPAHHHRRHRCARQRRLQRPDLAHT